MSLEKGQKEKKPQLGERLRALREERGLKLPELAKLTGLSRSSLYKVENSGMSLTYDKLIDLAYGLNIDVTELFQQNGAEVKNNAITARREIGRVGEGYNIKTDNYDYHYLCPGLRKKDLIPILGKITAKSIDAFDELTGHPGEEFTFVIKGSIEVHTEHYAPVKLEEGDYIYMDSTMPHAFISPGKKPAQVLTVCTSPSEDTQTKLHNLS